MLSIGKLGVATGAEYYLDTVANNVDDYYLGRGEVPGQWIGTAAAELGLFGEVDPDSLRNLLAGLSATGDSLGARMSDDRRPGFDLTFSAPKSISLLWAFGCEEVRAEISAAHDRSVRTVLDQLSAEACYARRGAGGHQLIEANGFIGAAFRHRTSRAGDPQLHTHVVVPNLVQGTDGRWSAPDGRHLYAWKMTAGALYRSALRADLGLLGLAWQVRRNGLSEVAGIPKAILRAFSKRRVEIEASLEERGLTSANAAAQATLATRARKPAVVAPTDLLRESWSAQLAEIRLPDGTGSERAATVDDVTRALDRESVVFPDAAETEAIFSILAGEKKVSLDEWELDERAVLEQGGSGHRVMPVTLFGSTFSRRDAITAVARAFDVTPREAVAFANRFLERKSVVRILAEPEPGRDAEVDDERLRTKGGQLVPVTSGDRRYTTTELLAAEERIVASAKETIRVARGLVSPELVDQVLELHPHLDGEQADGVRKLLTSGNGYDIVIGQAGTGKSTMLKTARAGWEAVGLKVIGAAVASRTAADLEAGTGIPSSSLSQLLADLRESGRISSDHVIVVDEASMVGTRALDELCSHTNLWGVKVVLVGDNRQLSSIDAGGALRTLAEELGSHVITLTTNRRQADPDQQWERDALVKLRDGSVAPAIQAYLDHGRVTISTDIVEARQRLIDDWWKVHHERSTAIMAVRRADVAALNELARARRQAGGELGQEYILGDKTFAAGDRVIFERNQRVRAAGELSEQARAELVRIRNGTFATVEGAIQPTADTRHPDAPTREGDVPGDGERALQPEVQRASGLIVTLDDGQRVVLPKAYVEASTNLGYALTVFRSQGITVDHAFGLAGDSLFQEAGYTQLSRGRLSNNLYVTGAENPRWEIGHLAEDREQQEGLRSLVENLSRSREQRMASDNLPQVPTIVSPEEVDGIYRQHGALSDSLVVHAPLDVSDQLANVHWAQVEARLDGRPADPQLKVEVTGLRAAKHQRDAWVADHRDEIRTWSRLDAALRRHEYRLGQAASYGRPEHLTALLGPLPTRTTRTEQWQFAAGAIEAYRHRWHVTGEGTIGPEPSDPEQRGHWRRAVASIGSAGFLADLSSRELTPELASMGTSWEAAWAVDRQWERKKYPQLYPEPELSRSPTHDRSRHRDRDRDRDYGFGL